MDEDSRSDNRALDQKSSRATTREMDCDVPYSDHRMFQSSHCSLPIPSLAERETALHSVALKLLETSSWRFVCV